MGLTIRTHLLFFVKMAKQASTAAPEAFVRLLRKAIAAQGLSLRDIGRRIGTSSAHMSRLVNKKRGLPDDDTIIKLEEALDIERGALFDAAGRLDTLARKFHAKQNSRPLMRLLAPLSDKEMEEVLKLVGQLARQYHPKVK